MNRQKVNLVINLGTIILSIVVAIVMAKTGILISLLTASQQSKFIGSLVAGIFFVSVFSAAPATVALAEIAQSNSILSAAFFGGIGALIGDLVIFRFVKDRLSQDFLHLIERSKRRRIVSIFRSRLFRWLLPFLGALIIASPLPDEVGVAIMGLSKLKPSLFIPMSFMLNALGIFVIGLIAKAV